MHKYPSQKLNDLLNGRTAWDDADPAIQSWCRTFIHDASVGILNMPKEKRRAAIDRAPVSIRPLIEKEIKRIWKLLPE